MLKEKKKEKEENGKYLSASQVVKGKCCLWILCFNYVRVCTVLHFCELKVLEDPCSKA